MEKVTTPEETDNVSVNSNMIGNGVYRGMSGAQQETRIGTEVVQSHSLLKWVMAVAGSNLLVLLVGGFNIYFNDAQQDKELVKQAHLIETKQSKAETRLLKELLEAKIAINSRAGDDIKQILFRMEDDIKAIRATDNSLHRSLDKRNLGN